MAKRDRAAYMRAYRAKRAESEAVSAPPPVREFRDHRHSFTEQRYLLNGPDTLMYLCCSECGRNDGPPTRLDSTPNTIMRLTQAQRDDILRKLTK